MRVELHLHLEGAAPPAFVRGLAREKSIDISGIFEEGGAYRRGDFADRDARDPAVVLLDLKLPKVD